MGTQGIRAFSGGPRQLLREPLACALLVGLTAVSCAKKSNPTGPAVPHVPADWPMLGRDVRSTYSNSDERTITTANVSHLRETWKLGGMAVTGAAAVVGDTAYVLSSASLSALDLKNRKTLWTNTDTGGSSSPSYTDGVVYVAGSMGGETLSAIDAKTGKTKWTSPIDTDPFAAGYSSPIVAGKLVLIGDSSAEEGSASANATFHGAVVAFDAATGKEAWRFATVAPPYNGCSVWSTVSLDLDAKRIFASTGNNYTEKAGSTSDSLFGLDLDTGKQAWQFQASQGDVYTIVNPQSPDSDFGTNPIVFEATVGGQQRKLVGAGQKSGKFWVLDRTTGEKLWERDLGPGSPLGGVMNNGAFDGERIYVASNMAASTDPGGEPAAAGGSGISTLFALNPVTGDIFWERQLRDWVWAPITLANGVGFVAPGRVLEAFDVKSGKKLFEHRVAGTIASAPVVANGRVIFGSGMSFASGLSDDKVHVLELSDSDAGAAAEDAGGGEAPCPSDTCTRIGLSSWTVDSTSVYWVDSTGPGPDGGTGTLKKAPFGGSNPTTLATGLPSTWSLVVDATSAYWTSYDTGTVSKVALTGGTPTILVSGQAGATALAVDATNVYWATSSETGIPTGKGVGTIMKAPLAGGAPTTLATTHTPYNIAIDATSVYWADNTPMGTIMKVPLAGGTATTLASAQAFPDGIAVDATSVYWANVGASTVMKVPLAGGTPTTIASGQSGPLGVALAGGFVYWSAGYLGGGGALRKAPINGPDGGAPTTLLSGLPSAPGFQAYGTTVYWNSDDRVMRVPAN
jgi:polyvinyl alcohol dehydrogenase (cytochrome)